MVGLVRFLTNALALVAGLAMALMMLHVMADVVGKYVFNQPVPSTAEVVANYYMIAGVFLPLAWVEATNGSIVVELIYDLVPQKARKAMLVIADLCSALFYGGLGWFSWDVAMRAYRINETLDGIWRVVIWPAKFMLPLGLALAVAVLVLRLATGSRADITDPASAAEKY
ncbi:TRAP transporter small permease subunit [Aquamicrobium sp. LC103]|uniref:TRAP transporter small permease subunit n=1 Tax=Aquamicrobium sp. LC103 TaxID=1120658 RepID=UPI00063EB5D6|nr:TRAP transporter small permease subunit [Aquamicrobium sp. LC103]TKT78273.1 TRAP transporter small permease [Aquamicrobium sp. LC103]